MTVAEIRRRVVPRAQPPLDRKCEILVVCDGVHPRLGALHRADIVIVINGNRAHVEKDRCGRPNDYEVQVLRP